MTDKIPQESASQFLDIAERYQKNFVTPLVDAVRAELSPIKNKLHDHDLAIQEVNQRIGAVEGVRNKAMAVYGVLVLLGGAIFSAIINKIKSWLRI